MKESKTALDADLAQLLAERQAPSELEPAVAKRLKARILRDAVGQTGGAKEPAERSAVDLAQGLFTLRADDGRWESLTPKVEIKVLRQDENSRSYLLRLHPGAVLPPHEHPIDEECYVLEGEVRFGQVVVQAGDYHLAPAGAPHGLMRSRTGALLLLRGAEHRGGAAGTS
ncbi:MAG: cupin domain-containing protein [Thiohalocapsa sp.]